MELIEKKCPNCGASLEFKDTDTSCSCQYCHRNFIIEKNKALDGEDFDRQFDLKELEKNMAATNMVIFTVGVILIIGVIIFTIIGSN